MYKMQNIMVQMGTLSCLGRAPGAHIIISCTPVHVGALGTELHCENGQLVHLIYTHGIASGSIALHLFSEDDSSPDLISVHYQRELRQRCAVFSETFRRGGRCADCAPARRRTTELPPSVDPVGRQGGNSIDFLVASVLARKLASVMARVSY